MVMGDDKFSQKLLAALPADPFEQLELAQRLVSRAVAAGMSKLEAETGQLRQNLDDKDATILSMQHRLVDLEQSLEDTSFRLSQALESQERVVNEKNMLASNVQKLNHDISKLEIFKKNLLQSLQEDDDSVKLRTEDLETSLQASFLDSNSFSKVDGRGGSIIPKVSQEDLYRSRLSTTVSDPALTIAHGDHEGNHTAPAVGRGSESVFKRSETGIQARGSFLPASKSIHSSMPPISAPVQKVDGKEFFRQARSRLSYQQFSAFLSNIKELNSHRQSREETLTKAYQIFGPENQDLYHAFYGLITHTTM